MEDLYALERECIAPNGSDLINHRQDQVLTPKESSNARLIILGQ